MPRTPDLSRLFVSPASPEAVKAKPVHLVKGGQPGEITNEDKRVVINIEDIGNTWNLSGAAASLPEGTYILADESNIRPEDAHKLMVGWGLGQYKFRFEDSGPTSEPAKVNRLVIPQAAVARLSEAVNELAATWKVRDLINLPSNILNTRDLAAEVSQTAKMFGVRADIQKIFDPVSQKAYPLIHAVGRASSNPPFMTRFNWSGSTAGPNALKIMIVGKGIVFDTGGLQLKPGQSMKDMRKDMGGAAHALGLAQLVMSNDLPVHLNVLVPIAENAVSANAYRPNDIIKARDGTWVKIGHTDAEGRLILADAITSGLEGPVKPDLILNFATLTGAQRVADGYEVGGVFSDKIALGRMLEDLGSDQQDELQFHRLHEHLHGPKLWDNNDNTLISSPGQQPGAILAALFLKHFTRAAEKTAFVHFDINGMNLTAKPGKPYGGEAMGLRASYRLIEKLAGRGPGLSI